MVSSRLATAVVGILLSLLVSAAAWFYFDSFLLFLVVPFVPLLLRWRDGGTDAVPDRRRCPMCGFETHEPGYEFCPRDGTALERVDR